MIAIDAALEERARTDRPIQIGLVGAGAAGRAIALQVATSVPGMRIAAIANRTLNKAERAYHEAGIESIRRVGTAPQLAAAIRDGVGAVAEDVSALCTCEALDVVVEVTGTIGFGARVACESIAHGRHVVLVNAELDATLGPILSAKARRAGVVITNTDGDEPGVAMTLLRYLRTLGLRPVAAGNLKGMIDPYRTPDTQRAFAERTVQDVHKVTSFADGTKLAMEATVLANATGFVPGRRGMYGPACADVRELARLLPADQMLAQGLVDYALGAAPHTGAWVMVHEPHPEKQRQLAYYKLGDGPFYVFCTPYHLPHVQIVSTIARAVLAGDATVAPLAGPVAEVITVAKRDLRAGDVLDGIGGFASYGQIASAEEARRLQAIPMGLSSECTLVRDVPRDAVIRLSDVIRPADRLADRLWNEQAGRWRQERSSSSNDAPVLSSSRP